MDSESTQVRSNGKTRGGGTGELGFAAPENKVYLHAIHATILSLMDMDHEALTYFHQGRE